MGRTQGKADSVYNDSLLGGCYETHGQNEASFCRNCSLVIRRSSPQILPALQQDNVLTLLLEVERHTVSVVALTRRGL